MSGCSQVPSYSKVAVSDFEAMADGERHGSRERDGSRRDGDEASVQIAAARKLEENGAADKAIREYQRLTAEFPSEATPFHRLAVLYDVHGQSDKSAREYLAAMHLAPNDNEILCDYGYSRYLQGDLHLAEDILREAVSRSPHMERAHNNLALVFAIQDRDDEAIAEFQKAGCTARQARANLKKAHRAAELSIENVN